MPRSPSFLILISLLMAVGGIGGEVYALDFSVAGVSNRSPWQPSPDTLRGIDRATQLIRNHYRGAGQSASARGNRMGGTLDRYCSGGEGSVCHGGDPDRGECNAGVPCHPNEEWFLEGLLEEAQRYPSSGFLMGQATYALTKFGRYEEVEELVGACQAEEWWCKALRGYALFAYAPMEIVELQFRSALDEAPAEVRCRWGDALWLLGKWDQRVGGVGYLPPGREETPEWDCPARMAASDTLWWLADPLFGREGNDRWAEHMGRAVGAELFEELRRAIRGSDHPKEDQDYEWAMRIRRGTWDSYERLPGRNTARFWTSEEAAQYHFIPEVEPGDFFHPVWRIRGDIQDEGYTPEYGPVFPIATQLARFRDGDSLLMVAAGDREGTRLRRSVSATSYLTLSDGPGSFPLRVEGATRRETPVLMGRAPHLDYMVGFEMMTGIGVGIAREWITALHATGPEISDLLLHTSREGGEPETLSQATATMMGAARLEEGAQLGVFWEVYDVSAGETLSFELTLERNTGGLVDRLTGFFPGGAQEGRGRVAWTESALGEIHPRGITLNLSDLRTGDYILGLTVQWPGQPPLERRRTLTVG